MVNTDLAGFFGRERRPMPSGDHVEVVREAARPGERVRYSKRFLRTEEGDFRPWTVREAEVLARLGEQRVGHVVRRAGFQHETVERPAQLQTFDAGISVDQWAALLPSRAVGPPARHVFEDCAHRWALAHHSLVALDSIHARGLVHLDLKADNVCVPWRPVASDAGTEPSAAPRRLRFDELALIDFAFCAIHGEASPRPLPLRRETAHEYQSPRLVEALEAGRRGDLGPTRALDWRCDLFSLAALLWLYLPEPDEPGGAGWSDERRGQATVLVRRLLDEHDAALPARRPHGGLIELAATPLADPALEKALARGWTFEARRDDSAAAWAAPLTRVAAAEMGETRAEPAARSSPRSTRSRSRAMRCGLDSRRRSRRSGCTNRRNRFMARRRRCLPRRGRCMRTRDRFGPARRGLCRVGHRPPRARADPRRAGADPRRAGTPSRRAGAD